MVKKINNKLHIDYGTGIIESRLLQIITKDPLVNILNLIPVWVIDIHPKDSGKILTKVKTLTEVEPVNLQHLKRVKKETNQLLTVIVCSLALLETQDQVIDKLEVEFDINQYTNLRCIEVPDHGPTIKDLSQQWTNEHWPLIWKGNSNDQLLNDAIINMDWIHSHLQAISAKSIELSSSSSPELPIVTLIAKDSEIISISTDTRSLTSPLNHSIINSIEQITATQRQDSNDTSHQYLLQGYDVYTTHEPCTMCCMALIHSRVNRLVYLKQMPRTGSLKSRYFVHDNKYLNSKYEVWEWIGDEYGVGEVQEDINC